MTHHRHEPPSFWDRVYVAILCATVIGACGLVAAECAAMVVQ